MVESTRSVPESKMNRLCQNPPTVLRFAETLVSHRIRENRSGESLFLMSSRKDFNRARLGVHPSNASNQRIDIHSAYTELDFGLLDLGEVNRHRSSRLRLSVHLSLAVVSHLESLVLCKHDRTRLHILQALKNPQQLGVHYPLGTSPLWTMDKQVFERPQDH